MQDDKVTFAGYGQTHLDSLPSGDLANNAQELRETSKSLKYRSLLES
jgi:hypothetical protein